MKKLLNILSVITLLALVLTLMPTAALAQEEVVCDSDVVIQADDWLSKLADNSMAIRGPTRPSRKPPMPRPKRMTAMLKL